MTRLALALLMLVAPLTGTTSLAQDQAYWDAAHTWQHQQHLTYWAHTLIAVLAAAILARKWRRIHSPYRGRDARRRRT